MQKQPLISLLLDLKMLNLRAEFNFASQLESWYSCIFFGDYHAFILGMAWATSAAASL